VILHIRDDHDVAAYIFKHLSGRPSITEAIDDGKWKCLGKFDTIIAEETLPGWVLRVTSLRVKGKHWDIGLYTASTRIGIKLLNKIPWNEWTPDASCSDPKLCKLLKLDFDMEQKHGTSKSK